MSPHALLFLLALASTTVETSFPPVRGTVVQKDDGSPVAGATIEDQQGQLRAVTAGDGTFEFRLPMTSREFLTVRAHGLATTRVPLPRTEGRITLPPIELSRGATVTIALKGDAARVRRIVLQHTGRGTNERIERDVPVEKDASEVVLRDVAPGAYRIVARGTEPLEAAGTRVTIEPAGHGNAVISIKPFVLTLHVRHGKRAVPGASVTFEGNDTGALGEVTTNADGTVAARMFQGGQWFLVTETRELQQPYLSSATLEADENEEWTVEIPAKRIHGTVRDAATGKPVGEVAVDVTFHSRHNGEPISGSYSAMTDAAGSYELTGVREGRYLLTFRHEHYRPSETLDFRVEEWDESVERNTTLEKQAQAIRVRVIDATGTPLPRTSVIVTPLPAHPTAARHYQTNGEGEVALDTIHGPVIAFAVPGDASFGLVRIEPRRTGDDPIALRVLNPSSNLFVRVVTKDGIPLQQLRLVMRWDGWMIPPSVIRLLERQPGHQLSTGADGRIVLRGVPAGMYELWPYRSVEEAEDIVTAGGKAPISLNVAPGETRVTVTVDRRALQPPE
ncbi:MAG TPA: carboxypeptidase regulatory-like domain-containing protein [Thermoanaerobaculia bacterium]|jgi:hypothetical protein